MSTTLDVSVPGVGDLLSDFESLALWESMHAGDGPWTQSQLARATGFPDSVVATSLERLEAHGLCRRVASADGHASFGAAPGPLVVTFDPADEASQLRLSTIRLGLMGHLQRMSDHHASMPAAAMNRDLVATVAVDRELMSRLGRQLARVESIVTEPRSGDASLPQAAVSLSVRPVRGGLRLPVVLLIPATDAAARANPRLPSLSPRELEVASLLADGRTKQEIAERLGVSFSTVNTITSRVYRKLGVSRRAALVNVMRG